jgi:4-carboxymuconolactone decarboxylase
MTVLDMNPATLPAHARAMYESMAARRKAKGEGFGGPYLALLNHPELARRVEELGFFLKFEGALPRTIYQFIVLTIARATGAGFESQDHIAHARAAGLPEAVIDCIGSERTAGLPQPYALVQAILAKTTAWQVVPDELQAQAVAQWGKPGLVEIVVLSGFYQMFAAINQGFGVQGIRGQDARLAPPDSRRLTPDTDARCLPRPPISRFPRPARHCAPDGDACAAVHGRAVAGAARHDFPAGTPRTCS